MRKAPASAAILSPQGPEGPEEIDLSRAANDRFFDQKVAIRGFDSLAHNADTMRHVEKAGSAQEQTSRMEAELQTLVAQAEAQGYSAANLPPEVRAQVQRLKNNSRNPLESGQVPESFLQRKAGNDPRFQEVVARESARSTKETASILNKMKEGLSKVKAIILHPIKSTWKAYRSLPTSVQILLGAVLLGASAYGLFNLLSGMGAASGASITGAQSAVAGAGAQGAASNATPAFAGAAATALNI